VAAGVALAQASRDLDDARDRLTSVRLEERRVLRRELHDGLGPSLAGIRLGLQGARNLVAQDPIAAETLLAQLQAELDHRVDDVRALSRSLLPPVLDELGLAAALHDLASRQSQSGLDVSVRCDAAADLDARTAQAAYGIVAEAVTNVVRHSGARTCRIVVTEHEVLDVLVEDDGAGFSPHARSGVGTQSMRERAEEQGGSLRIEAAEPSGTRVHATLPLVRSA
jgi:signal transduction histidine kinase